MLVLLFLPHSIFDDDVTSYQNAIKQLGSGMMCPLVVRFICILFLSHSATARTCIREVSHRIVMTELEVLRFVSRSRHGKKKEINGTMECPSM